MTLIDFPVHAGNYPLTNADGEMTGMQLISQNEVFKTGQHYMFGVLTVLFFVVGVPGGCLSMCYFLRKTDKTINTHLFILINITDILICFLMTFVGISHFALGDPLMFGDSVFCNLWAMLWQIAIRVSVFLVAMLNVTRVISILKPIYKISINGVIFPVAVYGGFIAVQSTVPLWAGSQYQFHSSLSRCSWNSTAYLGCSRSDSLYSTLHMLIEWSLPVLPVITSCILLVYKLQCKVHAPPASSTAPTHHHHRGSVTSSHNGTIRRESTITIVILAAVYILCSITSAVFYFGLYLDYLIDCGVNGRFGENLNPVVMTLITTFAIPLNSVLNTVIYFCRIKDLRTFSITILRLDRCVKKSNAKTGKFELQSPQ